MEELDLSEFVKLVADMRIKQNTYFRTRTSAALNAAKAAERLVDAVLAIEKDRGMPKQEKLF